MTVIARSMPKRALLAAVVAVAAFGFLGGHPLAAGAAPNGTDGDVVLGGANSCACETYISTSAGPAMVLDATGLSGAGLYSSGDLHGVDGFASGSEWDATGVLGQGVIGAEGDGTNYGVIGNTNSGVGVFAEGGGTALKVNGKATFSMSGIAVIPSGSNHVSESMYGVTTASMVLATVQQNNGFYVKDAVASSGSFTIYINKAPTSPTTVKVAYFVLS